MVRLVTGLGHFKVIKELFGAVVLTEMLCVLHLHLLTSQRMVFLPFEVQFPFVESWIHLDYHIKSCLFDG